MKLALESQPELRHVELAEARIADFLFALDIHPLHRDKMGKFR